MVALMYIMIMNVMIMNAIMIMCRGVVLSVHDVTNMRGHYRLDNLVPRHLQRGGGETQRERQRDRLTHRERQTKRERQTERAAVPGSPTSSSDLQGAA